MKHGAKIRTVRFNPGHYFGVAVAVPTAMTAQAAAANAVSQELKLELELVNVRDWNTPGPVVH